MEFSKFINFVYPKSEQDDVNEHPEVAKKLESFKGDGLIVTSFRIWNKH